MNDVMPPTDNDIQRQIFEVMTRVLSDDYESRFKPAYEAAARLTSGLPMEPAEEIRNAFDHFAAATAEAVRTEDDRDAVVNERLESALTHLQRARRHILTGMYYSIEHQLTARMESIKDYIERLTPDEKASLSRVIENCTELNGLIGSLMYPEIGPTLAGPELQGDIAALERRIQEISRLAIDGDRLYESLRESVGSR
jgi:hypothetical protein